MESSQFHKKYLSLSSRLYRVAFYILESEQDAEDALQELYLKLWQGRDRLDGIVTPEAYCIRILKNICIDRIRSSRKVALVGRLPEEESETDQAERMDSRQRMEKVLAAVKSLPERQKQILTLRLIEGRSYEEISGITKLNYLTIRVMLSKARKKLKQIYEKY